MLSTLSVIPAAPGTANIKIVVEAASGSYTAEWVSRADLPGLIKDLLRCVAPEDLGPYAKLLDHPSS